MAETTYIALAGNPNCGKTTLFNELTGSNGYVGNWPGVTVEKKQAPWKKERDVELVDLPGIYSLSPYSPEEVVSRDFLVNDRPDAVVDLIDVTNLERNLYLTTQVLEAGRPVVVGLNMCDLLKERGDAIDAKKLSSMLGVPVVEVSALRNRNLDKLMQQAVDAARDGVATKGVRCFSSEVESALQKVQAIVGDAAPADLARWYAIKVFERDADAIEPLALSKAQLDAAEEVIAAVEKSRDDDAESIVTGERYDWIATVMDACVKKAPKRLTTSQKIDRVVTNRVLGLPIFAAVMIAVYWVALVAVGTPATDWVNDNLFSDGFFANSASQQKYDADTAAYEDGHYADKIDGFLAAADEKGIDTSAASKALAADTRSAADERAIKAFEAEVAGVVARDVPQHDPRRRRGRDEARRQRQRGPLVRAEARRHQDRHPGRLQEGRQRAGARPARLRRLRGLRAKRRHRLAAGRRRVRSWSTASSAAWAPCSASSRRSSCCSCCCASWRTAAT